MAFTEADFEAAFVNDRPLQSNEQIANSEEITDMTPNNIIGNVLSAEFIQIAQKYIDF